MGPLGQTFPLVGLGPVPRSHWICWQQGVWALLDFLFRKRKLRRELDAVRAAIASKRVEVEKADAEARRAWGKKWSYLQQQRRRKQSDQETEPEGSEHALDGQAGVLEFRRKQILEELKAREQELADLQAKEQQLVAELGEVPTTPSEVDDEKR